MKAKNRVIVALDVDSVEKAISLTKQLAPYVGNFKIGPVLLKPLLCRKKWDEFAKMASEMKISLFIDEKLHHSPEVMTKSVNYYNFPLIKMFTIDASCGQDSLRAAVGQKGITIPSDVKILISTVLTSIDRQECIRIFRRSPEKQVVKFAFDALETKCDGIVCSAHELRFLAKNPELTKLEKFVPGIRPKWWRVATDQRRVDTPAGAIEAGADHLIIGRPILNPPPEIGGPVEAIKRIIEEIESVI